MILNLYTGFGGLILLSLLPKIMSRIVLHCDLDCFFAAVEIRDNPQFKGKPVIIGADPKEGKGRGVISTCNYEARKYGLHSAMPISLAYRRCPHGIYLKPNGNKYYKVSNEVMDILEKYSNDFQKVGTDEAYLELTEITQDFEEVDKIAKKIQKEVFDKIGITISIGIAPTKSLAKIASDENKPNGITIVKPETIFNFLKDMEITRIPGIGKKTKVHFFKKGIKKIGDIINTPLSTMIKLFGKHGSHIWHIVNGIDDNKICTNKRSRNSISKERTFVEDTDDFSFIFSKLNRLNELINNELKERNYFFRTITLKIRFENFSTFTRAKTFQNSIQDKNIALKTILDLYGEFHKQNKKIRLVGIKFSNLTKCNNRKQLVIQNFI